MQMTTEELAAPYLLNLVANALFEIDLTDSAPSITVDLTEDAASFFRRNDLKRKFFTTMINGVIYEIFIDSDFKTATIFDLQLMGIDSTEEY
jgi:hypothetical protein